MQQEDENFMSMGSRLGCLRASGSVVGIGSLLVGTSSTITQQVIQTTVVGDAPTFQSLSNEIIDSLALEPFI